MTVVKFDIGFFHTSMSLEENIERTHLEHWHFNFRFETFGRKYNIEKHDNCNLMEN